jgi:hypothetical protein
MEAAPTVMYGLTRSLANSCLKFTIAHRILLREATAAAMIEGVRIVQCARVATIDPGLVSGQHLQRNLLVEAVIVADRNAI